MCTGLERTNGHTWLAIKVAVKHEVFKLDLPFISEVFSLVDGDAFGYA